MEDRAVPGHWEGNLLFEKKWPDRDLGRAADTLRHAGEGCGIEHARKLPEELYQSLTWNRGKERSTVSALHWRPISKCISVIRTIRGSAGRIKIQMAY